MVSLHDILQREENGIKAINVYLLFFIFLSIDQSVAGKRKEQRLLSNMSVLSQEGHKTAAKWDL